MATIPPPEDVPDEPGDPESVARLICLQLLTQRDRTRSELAQALARRGVPADAAGRVLTRLTEIRLLDDAAAADSFVLHQHHEQGLSRRAIAVRLRSRGVDEQTLRSALNQIDTESEQAAAVHLVRRKLRSLDGLEPHVRDRRIFGLLARRGYSAEVALKALHAVAGDVRPIDVEVVDDAVR